MILAMEKNFERLENVIKIQAEAFLLDANEFYPFGSYINMKDEIVPVAAYLEGDRPPSAPLIALLEKRFKTDTTNYKAAAMAIDISININEEIYDAIELRFFEPNKNVFKKHIKYKVKDGCV